MTPQFNTPPPWHTLKAKTDLLRAYDKVMRFTFWVFLKAEVNTSHFLTKQNQEKIFVCLSSLP